MEIVKQVRRIATRGVPLALGACAVFALVAGPAHAAGSSAPRSLDLNVHGTIAQQCGIGRVGNMDFGDLTRHDLRSDARVQFNCNVPFQVKVQSANGGLANSAYPNGQGPYAGRLPYSIGFVIPVLKPSASMVSRIYQSGDLIGGQTFSSEGGIATDGMDVSVNLGRPSGDAGLLAGSYSETITITVSPV